ncbi:MFS transporter [Geodermatophilus africanus]|uniref:MFS transporter n=1 Tax=Geodermatophilus africanus TaxID=1137993 RepID=UPI001FCD9D6C|nr:MFS transporter [Geodermatophilus africanus]
MPRLQVAVAAVFALDGAVFGSWAARVPDVAAGVGIGHSALGVALLCLSIGALAAMQVTGALCARLGAGVVTAAASLLLCVSLVLPGLATSLPALCAALLVFGGATGMVNVAANAVGVTVERRLGRPLLSGLHAGFSFGGLAGALLGGLLATVAGVAAHLVFVGALGLLVTAWAARALVRADGPRSAAPGPAGADGGPRPTAVLVVLGAIAGCTAFGEGALSDWGALHLRDELGATTSLAAAGYAGFSLAMACGRLAGGRLVAALGERRLLAGGAVLAAAGGAAAVTATSVSTALGGFVLVGLGLANVFPLAISRAGVLGGARGIALATTVGYTGLLGGPPLIGLLAEHAGLAAALATVPLLALVAGVLVLSVAGDALRVPVTPRGLVAAVAPRVQPLVSGFGHGTAVYVRDLRVLDPSV